MRRNNDAHRTIHPRKFFDGGDVLHVAHAGAAQFRGKNDSHQAQLAQFLDRGQRILARLVPFHDVRRNLTRGKIAHASAQMLLLFVELEIQGLPSPARSMGETDD